MAARFEHLFSLRFWPSIASFALVVSVAALQADAAIVDDAPTCRCLYNLSQADMEGGDEERRRDAARIVDDYCEEDRSLDALSGSDRWLADQSCLLLQQDFAHETENLDDEANASFVDIVFKVELAYVGRTVSTNFFEDWRHDVSLMGQISFTLWPARSGSPLDRR